MSVAYRSTCWPIVGQQLSVDIYRATYQSSGGRDVDWHIGSVSVDVSYNTQSIYRSTYWPTYWSRGAQNTHDPIFLYSKTFSMMVNRWKYFSNKQHYLLVNLLLATSDPILSMAWSYDHNMLICGQGQKFLRIFDIRGEYPMSQELRWLFIIKTYCGIKQSPKGQITIIKRCCSWLFKH